MLPRQMSQPAPIRLAVLDSDTGFLQVLAKRLEGVGWQHRVLASPVPLDAIVAMRLNAVVLDLAVLGPQGWNYLEKLCTRAARARRDRLHRAVLGRPARARAAAGRRRLGDQAVPPGGADRARRGRRAAAQARRGARRTPARSSSARSRSAPTSSRPSSAARRVDLTRREFELIQLLADAEGQVLQREEIYQRVWGYAMVHGDRSVDVFVRKLRQKLEKVVAGLALHPHALRDRLPVRGRAGRRRGGAGATVPPRSPEPAPSSRAPVAAAPRRAERRPIAAPRGSYRFGSWARTATRTCATSRS